MPSTCTIASETCGFQCTGYEGSHVWRKLHNAVNSIECESCREHAVKNMSGFHDHHNAGLGYDLYDPENYERFVYEINCVYKAYCKKHGGCKYG